MVGRRIVALTGLLAVLTPVQGAFAAPDMPLPPPPPPPTAPPPPPPGLRPMVGPDGSLVTDAQGRPQFVIDVPQPPVAPARPTGVPQILMRHLTPASPVPGLGGPGAPPPAALPVPAAGQGLRDVAGERVVVPPPGAAAPHREEPASTLPQPPAGSQTPLPPPPASEGGRRPGGPRGL